MVKVGIFDSGVGGLTVLSACMRRLPQVKFYYLGDNLHAPYGDLPRAEITRLVRSALSAFSEWGVDAAVLACNTATSVCAEQMRREFPFPIVGMEPAVSLAAKYARRVLVLCTPVTAAGEKLSRLLARFPDTEFFVYPAKDLAPSIERALIGDLPLDLPALLPPKELFSASKGEWSNFAPFVPQDGGNASKKLCAAWEKGVSLDDYPKKSPEFGTKGDSDPRRRVLTTSAHPFDAVVLGCTHYVFYREEIERFYGVPVFDGNEGTAKRLETLLFSGTADHHIFPKADKNFRAVFPVFLGDCAEINENIHFSNKCFQKFLQKCKKSGKKGLHVVDIPQKW